MIYSSLKNTFHKLGMAATAAVLMFAEPSYSMKPRPAGMGPVKIKKRFPERRRLVASTPRRMRRRLTTVFDDSHKLANLGRQEAIKKVIKDYNKTMNKKYILSNTQNTNGNHSVVFKASTEKSGRGGLKDEIAIKVIDKDVEFQTISASAMIPQWRSEAIAMEKSEHKNVVKLLKKYETDQFLFFVMESGTGDLATEWCKYVKNLKSKQEREKVVMKIAQQILQGLSKVHQQKYMHLDIKALNILVGHVAAEKPWYSNIKLIDFGYVQKYTWRPADGELIGSAPYLAPEICTSGKYTEKADIWALGILTIMLLCDNCQPTWCDKYENYMEEFEANNPNYNWGEIITVEQRLRFLKGWGETDLPDIFSKLKQTELKHYTKECRDFLDKCLKNDPKKRSSAAKLLKHYVFMDGKTRKMVKLQEKLDNIVPPNEMFAAKKKNPYYTYKATAINKNGKFDYKFEVTCHLDEKIKKKQKKHTYSKTVKIGKQVTNYKDIKIALVELYKGYKRLKISKSNHIKYFSPDWKTILTKRGKLDECIRKFNEKN